MTGRPDKRIWLAALLVLLTGQYAAAVDLIAHRGYSCGSDENTAGAVARAWRAGAMVVELDVRVSVDNVIYLFHDDSIAGFPVSEQTFDELQGRSGHKLLTLDALLSSGPPPGHLLLDLKGSKEGQFQFLADLIDDIDFPHDRIMLQSSDLGLLKYLRQRLPTVQLYYLSRLKRKPPFFQKPKASSIIQEMEGYGVSGVSLKGRQFLGRKFISQIQDAGYRVNVWTINDPRRAAHYERAGVDGIITDKLAEFAAVESLCPAVAVL